MFSLRLDAQRPPIQVLVVQFSNEHSIQTILEQVYIRPGSSRRRASALILRPCVAEHFAPADLLAAARGGTRKPGMFLDAIAEASVDKARAFARFEDIPIFVLHSDQFLHRLSGNINPDARVPQLVEDYMLDPATIDAIRVGELEQLVARSQALLLPIEGAYYDPPSRKPIRSFLRIGNIQYSRQAVDALAFWLLPYVASSRGILIDTWSISSLAFNLSRVLTLYDGRSPIPVEMLTRYQDRSPEAQVALLDVLDRLFGECIATAGTEQVPITCIVSATQTGSLVDVLQDEIELAGLPIEMTFVALFQLGKTDALPSLCDQSEIPEFAPLLQASVEKRSAIHIDPQVYFPLAYRDMEFVLRRPQTRNFSEFVKRFGTEGVISAHRDQTSDGAVRHHAIHLNLQALFTNPAFETAFDAQIRALDPQPAVILTPRHDVARALGERARSVLAASGHNATLLHHPTLLLRTDGPFASADAQINVALERLTVCDGLLILDDCFITGDRLTAYQTRLRQLSVRARLHYRVGVARPEDIDHWTQCQSMLAYRDDADKAVYATNTVAAVHEMCLPNWPEPECPWCLELALYRRMQKQEIPLADHFLQRLDRLTDRDSGLVDDLFLVGPENSPLNLNSGSIFLPPGAPQATVFAAICSALQQLRTNATDKRPVLGPRRYPVATILKAREYLKVVYTDSILRSAILRAARSEELVYMAEASERRRTGLISALLTSPDQDKCDLAFELILAHAAGKCQIDLDIDSNVLEPTVADFLDIVKSVIK